MAQVQIDPEVFGRLKDQVIVMTGGATGIGAVLVSRLSALGAKLVWGDIHPPSTPSPPGTEYIRTDASSYASTLALFKYAWQVHGRIDHALANAGLVEIGELLSTTDETIEQEPDHRVLDVNLRGAVFFARIAHHFLFKSRFANPSQTDASLTLVSSVAALGNWPGLYQYSASKYGVLGLFRALKGKTADAGVRGAGIRVNVVLPNMTDTQMVTGVIALYKKQGLGFNQPEDVAGAQLWAMAEDVDGEAVYVASGKTYLLEDRLDGVKKTWLGEDTYEELEQCQMALGTAAAASGWTDGR